MSIFDFSKFQLACLAGVRGDVSAIYIGTVAQTDFGRTTTEPAASCFRQRKPRVGSHPNTAMPQAVATGQLMARCQFVRSKR